MFRLSRSTLALAVVFTGWSVAVTGCSVESGQLYQVSQAKARGEGVAFVLQPYRRVDPLFPAPPGAHLEPRYWHVTASVPTNEKLVPTSINEVANPDRQFAPMLTRDWAMATDSRRAWGPTTNPTVPPDFEPYASQSAKGRYLVLYRKSYPEKFILVDAESNRVIGRFAPDHMVLSDWDAETGRLIFSPQSFPARDTLRLAVWDPLQGWTRVFKPSNGEVGTWLKPR